MFPLPHPRTFALSALLLPGFWPVPAPASPFGVEPIGDLYVTYDASFVMGADDVPRIAFTWYTPADAQLWYAERHDGLWYAEQITVDASACRIVLQPDGEPGILYSHPYGGAHEVRYAFRSGGLWTTEFVDSLQSGFEIDAAVDPSGDVHACYHDLASSAPIYAVRSGGVWSASEVVDQAPSGADCRIAVDSSGQPFVAYLEAGTNDIYVATKSGGIWTRERIGLGKSGGYRLSIAVRSDDTVFLAAPTPTGIDFWWRDAANFWPGETVDASGLSSPSLALDSADRIHLAYTTSPDGEIRYAVRRSNYAWDTVATGFAVGAPWLQIDTHGRPRILCSGISPVYMEGYARVTSPVGGELWPAGSRQTVRWHGLTGVSISLSSDGGASWTEIVPSANGGQAEITVPSWATENARVRVTVLGDPTYVSDSPGTFTIGGAAASPWWNEAAAAIGSVGYFTSIDLGPEGVPGVAYYDAAAGDLVLATRAGGVWTEESVDSAGDVGAFCSLAYDDGGDAHVGYADVVSSFVKYARKTDGVWSVETADSSGTAGTYLSLALDETGEPHLSYQDFGLGQVRYARRTGGAWSVETVDATVLGTYSSVAVDRQGVPSVAYRDESFQDLRWARKVGGTWIITVVDSAGQTGDYVSLAVDDSGDPHISYYDATNGDLRYAHRRGSMWFLETVDSAGDVGLFTSLELDGAGNPHISYCDATNQDLRYARRINGVWSVTSPDTAGSVGQYTSLALDAQGSPRISHLDLSALDIRYASAAVEMGAPGAGVVWPVGAARTVTWDGAGTVDLSLSVDGGSTWQTLATGLTRGDHSVLVPHSPTRFAQLKLDRAVPRSESRTVGLFSIESSVTLLSFGAAPPAAAPGAAARGVRLEWATDPGPEDLAGYRVERSAAGGWANVVALTQETELLDPDGGPGSRYRLFAVNGLNEEYLVGETAIAAPQALAMWPLPFRGGELSVSFSTLGGFGDGRGPAEVVVHDIAGRRVRTLARGDYGAGTHLVTWDGRDEGGRPVASGVYFVRVNTAGNATARKVTVLR